MSIILIHPYPGRPEADVRLSGILSHALADWEGRTIRTAEELDLRPGDRVLFALALDGAGQNLEYYRMLSRLRREPDLLEGCTAALIVDGPGELYTKSTAGELGTDLMGAYLAAAQELVQRLDTFTFPQKERPELLVLHASSHHTSNTMALWAGVRERLGEVCSVQEIGLRNGTLDDCSGCPYTMCIHFGEKGECFYGGVMSREVYPAVRRADGVVMLCPNYNDALSANLTAFINRLTALFRQTRFYDKALFALVVSGYSGSDLVARQLISAMNMNKSFYVPGRFALLETANDPGEAMGLPGVRDRLDRFADHMLEVLARRA